MAHTSRFCDGCAFPDGLLSGNGKTAAGHQFAAFSCSKSASLCVSALSLLLPSFNKALRRGLLKRGALS
jgi:hypothetical protein